MNLRRRSRQSDTELKMKKRISSLCLPLRGLLLSLGIVAGGTIPNLAQTPQKDASRPLSAEDALSAEAIANGPISLSPDGKWVVYTVQDPKRRRTFGASYGGEIGENG